MKKYYMVTLAVGLLTGAAWGQWTEPQLVDPREDTLGVNCLSHDWCPFVTADGQFLYFASERDDPSATDVYVSRRAGNAWGNATRLPFCLPNVDERNPTVNATNDTLYFISWSGSWDIFWCFRIGPEDTAWSEPERMPEPINSTGIEFAVWATPDNQRLLFASWRISANGEDIYECRRDPTTATGWSNPVPLPGQLNTWSSESYPSMGLDTTELFWMNFNVICVSHLTDSGWSRGSGLPSNINRQTQESTPCITPDGRRLYFSSRYGEPPPAGDIWYSERPSLVPQSSDHSRDHGLRIEVFPNPFNITTHLEFTLPTTQRVSLRLYDVLGREAAVLVNEIQTAGVHRLTFDASGLPSGVYLCRLEAGGMAQTRKIVLVK